MVLFILLELEGNRFWVLPSRGGWELVACGQEPGARGWELGGGVGGGFQVEGLFFSFSFFSFSFSFFSFSFFCFCCFLWEAVGVDHGVVIGELVGEGVGEGLGFLAARRAVGGCDA